MPIHRVKKTKDYTVISNIVFRSGLGSGAIGLHCKVMSLRDDWKFSKAGLVAICQEGITAVQSMLKELKDKHFLKVVKLLPSETKSGRIEYVYHFYEVPYDDDEYKNSSEKSEKSKPKGRHKTYRTYEDVESVENVETVENTENTDTVEVVENIEVTGDTVKYNSEKERVSVPKQGAVKQDAEIQCTEIRTKSNTKKSSTKKSITKSINQSLAKEKSFQQDFQPKTNDRNDNANKYNENRSVIEQVIKENIDYDWYKEFFEDTPDNSENVGYETFAANMEDVDMLLEIIVGAICSNRDYIRVNGGNMSRDVVESRFMKLKMEHIEYALRGLADSETKVKNPIAYLTTVLYNASFVTNYAEINDLRSTDPYLFKPKYLRRQTSKYA